MWIFTACGVWLIGLGGYFMFVRPALLPEDLRYMGSTAIQVDLILPRLTSWLRNVFIVMGGFMAACGVLVVFISMRASPQERQAIGIALGCVGLLTVVVMSGINFMLDSDFKWLLLAPAVLWTAGIAVYLLERRS